MKYGLSRAVLLGLILIPCALIAQAPSGAPAGTTGKCKDGTFTSAPKKQGACRGHKGIDSWYASEGAPASNPAKSAAPAVAPVPAAVPKPASPSASAPAPVEKASSSAKIAAAGGGPGLVWVNTGTNFYHCYGTRYYGTTKAGKYMSEADAKAAGAHPDHGKACSQ
jgi:hypothetical protein